MARRRRKSSEKGADPEGDSRKWQEKGNSRRCLRIKAQLAEKVYAFTSFSQVGQVKFV